MILLQLVLTQDQVKYHTVTFNNDTSSSTVGIYSLNGGELQFLANGHSGGITHLVFSVCGNYLYSGGRKVCIEIMISITFLL